MTAMLQATAARRLVKELRSRRHLEATDEALVSLVVGLAAAVDGFPENAALWRQYREAEADLRRVGAGDPGVIEALIAELNTADSDAGATPVRDAAEG